MRSVITVTLPDGGTVAQVWCWSDVSIVDWRLFFRPLADLIPDAVWTAEPIPDDVTEKGAFLGH